MTNPFAPPESELDPVTPEGGEGAPLDPSQWPMVRNRLIVSGLIRAPLVIIPFFFFARASSRVLWATTALLVIVVSVRVWRAVERQRRLWPLLRYHLTDDGIEVTGHPDVERILRRRDIVSVRETNGGLILKGADLGQQIIIPSALIGYPDFRQQLIDWGLLDLQPSRWQVLRPTLVSIAVLGLIFAVVLTDAPGIIRTGGPIVLVVVVYQILRTVRSNALTLRTKAISSFALIYILAVVGFRVLRAFSLT